MQCIKHILSAIVIAALILSGVPVFSPDDASRDNRVDLEDAVLRVRDFAQTAEDPEMFAAGVEKAISALNAVAGLKAIISNHTEISAKPVCSDFCLISVFNFSIPSDRGREVDEMPMLYESAAVSTVFRYG